MKAIWNGVVLAQSDDTVVVEGNHYFPIGSVSQEHLRPGGTHTVCPWKGTASYYTVQTAEGTNPMRHGSTRSRKRARSRSQGALLFGKAFKSRKTSGKCSLRRMLNF